VNQDGQALLLCLGGDWRETSICVFEGACFAGEVRAGTTPCEFGSGRIDQVCTIVGDGVWWMDNGVCTPLSPPATCLTVNAPCDEDADCCSGKCFVERCL